MNSKPRHLVVLMWFVDGECVLEEGRDAHNITANAASRFSVESALEKERWHKILQPMRSSQYL